MTNEAKANAQIGRQLRLWRVQRNISLEAATADLSVYYQQVQRFEEGKGLSAARLRDLCRLYRIRPDDALNLRLLVDGDVPDLSLVAIKIAVAYDRLKDLKIRKIVELLMLH